MTYTTILQYDPKTHTYSVTRVEASEEDRMADVRQAMEQLSRISEEER